MLVSFFFSSRRRHTRSKRDWSSDVCFPILGKAKSSDRIFQGVRWVKKSGRPNTATPGLSNHGNGLAVDIHHGPIQEWMKSKGRSYGWDWAEGRRNGENWHFVYSHSRDSFKSEGYLDHAAVQKAIGAEVDGKVGPATKKAMGLSGKGESAPAPSAPAPTAPSSDGDKLTLVDLPEVETGKTSPNKNTDRRGHEVQHITVHWWGNPSGQSFDGI